MNKKQYRTTLIIFMSVAIAVIVTDVIWNYVDLLWVFIGVSLGYMYIRYKVTGPLQQFSTKFNMLIDYDLDVEEALRMTKELEENAPTEQVKQLLKIYLGMAYYYNGNYDDAIKTFNLINFRKVNQVYHILIFAFTAYSAYEINDQDTFKNAIDRMENAKTKISRKYFSFAANYLEILHAIDELPENPEQYKEVIERNFSREDGYLSTKLVYNYRMAIYYKTIGEEEEMNKCFARVIANGKEHHTAKRSREMFTGKFDVEEYKFPDPTLEPEEVEVAEEPLQIDQLEETETAQEEFLVGESEIMEELAEEVEEDLAIDAKETIEDLSALSVPELRDICREKGVKGYYKMKKSDLIEALKNLEK